MQITPIPTVDKIENFQEFIKFTSYTQGISIYTPKKVVKHFTTYYTYSTSKKWVEKEVTRMFNDFIDNLKKMIKDGKKAEKDLSEILNSKITI